MFADWKKKEALSKMVYHKDKISEMLRLLKMELLRNSFDLKVIPREIVDSLSLSLHDNVILLRIKSDQRDTHFLFRGIPKQKKIKAVYFEIIAALNMRILRDPGLTKIEASRYPLILTLTFDQDFGRYKLDKIQNR